VSRHEAQVSLLAAHLAEENKRWGALVVDGYLRLRTHDEEIAIFEKCAPDFFKAICDASTPAGLKKWLLRASAAQASGTSIKPYSSGDALLSGSTLADQTDAHGRRIKARLS
jgi:hypothetical protein